MESDNIPDLLVDIFVLLQKHFFFLFDETALSHTEVQHTAELHKKTDEVCTVCINNFFTVFNRLSITFLSLRYIS